MKLFALGFSRKGLNHKVQASQEELGGPEGEIGLGMRYGESGSLVLPRLRCSAS